MRRNLSLFFPLLALFLSVCGGVPYPRVSLAESSVAAPTANPDEPRKLPLRLAVAASGNLHPGKTSMFEPIHGSAPKYAGKNVACPLGGILAVSMMLDYLGEKQASASIERAVAHLLASGRIPSADACSGVSTTETGEMVVQTLQAKLALG